MTEKQQRRALIKALEKERNIANKRIRKIGDLLGPLYVNALSTEQLNKLAREIREFLKVKP